MTEDQETERAIQALTYRLQTRGEADIEPVAREFMIELRARGWRLTEARVIPGWQSPSARSDGPPPEWRQARAALEQKLNRPNGDAA